MRPAIQFQGEPDRIARTRALFARRLVLEPTWREHWALRWRIWMGEGLAIIAFPIVVAVIASALLILWWLED